MREQLMLVELWPAYVTMALAAIGFLGVLILLAWNLGEDDVDY
jgi:hypothetical protein